MRAFERVQEKDLPVAPVSPWEDDQRDVLIDFLWGRLHSEERMRSGVHMSELPVGKEVLDGALRRASEIFGREADRG
jgi:hypothetical protein